MCIIAAVGREFVFTLDTELLPTPTVDPEKNQELFKYLRGLSANSQLAIYLLQIII